MGSNDTLPVADDNKTSAPWHPPSKKRWASVAIASLAVLIVLLVLALWQLGPFATGVMSTANAYVRGRVAVIAPQVSGYVVQVAVHDYEQVAAGQLLVRVDDRIYRARVS